MFAEKKFLCKMGFVLDLDRLMYQADKICMFYPSVVTCVLALFKLTTKATDQVTRIYHGSHPNSFSLEGIAVLPFSLKSNFLLTRIAYTHKH